MTKALVASASRADREERIVSVCDGVISPKACVLGSSLMPNFLDDLCEAVLATDGGDAESRNLIGRAIADTVAVAAAGFTEPVTRLAAKAYAGPAVRAWSGEQCESREAAVMVNAIAAHSLEFDDVYLDGVLHPSAIIVPAALHCGTDYDAERVVSAVAAGLIAGRAIGARLGQRHYVRGWHSTGTVGVFAATAAAARLALLSLQQTKSAFALAAAMSGGLQKNFATMGKPCQVGFGAAGGVRAVRLAAADIVASPDIFESGGFFDLYGDGGAGLSGEFFCLRPDRISVKLYPCCYAASRLIGIALDAYRALGAIFCQREVHVRITVPRNTIAVLRYDHPVDSLQAKFSAPYTVCAALVDGFVGFSHFSEQAIARQDIRSCMRRLIITEDDTQASSGDLEAGTVRLSVIRDEELVGSYERSAIPGSPGDPPQREQIRVKAMECLSAFERQFGHPFPLLHEIQDMTYVSPWLHGGLHT